MKLCWFYQKAASWSLDDSAGVPRWLERHLGACPDCARIYQDQKRLTNALRTEAPIQVGELPPFLHARIIAGIHREQTTTSTRLPISYWVRAALIPALGVLVVATVLTWKPHDKNPTPPRGGPSDAGELASTLPKADPAFLLALTERIDQPLETEFHSVVNDAQQAFKSLTMNFLPEKLPGAK